MSGISEFTRVLRELFDQRNRFLRRTAHTSVTVVRDFPETPETADRVEMDGTQPSATPKWGDPPSWSRANNNVHWSEGAKWQ